MVILHSLQCFIQVSSSASSSQTSGAKAGGTVEQEYKRQMEVKEMVANEKSTTAIDQLTMFGRASKVFQCRDVVCSSNDYVILAFLDVL